LTQPKVAEVATARLKPAEWNPRTIREERFKNLCRSIQADPEFLWRRPILATSDGSIYAGNMRYRAAVEVGMTKVPAIIEDIPETLAKERALRDNAQWGDWQDDQLAELVYGLAADGADMELLGIEPDELARLLGEAGVTDFPTLPDGERGEFRTITFTVTADQLETVEQAMGRAKAVGFGDTGNENSNGNALARVCEVFLGVG
jgi:hypothetical protein